MKPVEQYLNEVLGADVRFYPILTSNLSALPLFLKHIFNFYKGKLLSHEIVLLEKKSNEHLTVEQMRKHSRVVEKAFNLSVVFVLPILESYNRKRLIQKQVAFIIPGKQLFIPQLLIDLRDFRQLKQPHGEKLLPATQCLLLFHLLKENTTGLNLKTIAEKMGYTQTTITRAARDLFQKNMINIEGTKEKKLIWKSNKKTLWQKALPILQSPVKKVYYLDICTVADYAYKTGYSALSFYTNLADEERKYWAVSRSDFNLLKNKKQLHIVDSIEGAVHLQLWKYPPGILSVNKTVDPLSLYLSLRDSKDERIQKEFEGLLARLW